MSQENVEIVRRANEAFNDHDLGSWSSFLDPEIRLVDHQGAVAEESISGNRVVCVTHWQGAGAGSGLPFSTNAAEIFEVRDGKIVHAELGFTDKAAALDAAGLEE